MKLNKTALSLALASVFCTGTAQALHTTPEIVEMSFDGLFTMLDPGGDAISNPSAPYYYDPTWGYGLRSQISGSFTINQFTGEGSATVNNFEFFNSGPAVISDFSFKPTDSGLLIGNFIFSWSGNNTYTQIVLDTTGLFAELSLNTQIGDTYDASSCFTSGACATPASDNINIKGKYSIGPVPIATSSFNTSGQTGYGTTLGQLSLGSDDAIGGSPQDNGPTSGFNINLDFTSLTVTATYPTPVPAAVWLFGSGLLGLASVARRRKYQIK